MARYNLLLALTILAISTCCGQKKFDKHVRKLYSGTVPLVHEAELQAAESILYLDTRSAEEFDVSHIDGAQLIDYESFEAADVAGIPRDTAVVVYCSVGYRSEKIGEQLQELGFTNVRNLYGGIFDWKNKDNPVVNDTGQPTDSVHTYNFLWSQWLDKGIKVY